jgi:hypothetical protein
MYSKIRQLRIFTSDGANVSSFDCGLYYSSSTMEYAASSSIPYFGTLMFGVIQDGSVDFFSIDNRYIDWCQSWARKNEYRFSNRH